MTPSMYDLPGYFQMTVLSFWIPTLVSLACLFLWRRDKNVRGTWVLKAATLILIVSVGLHLTGWIVDAIWLHTLSLDVGLVGSIVCGVWAIAYIVGLVKKKS
jgi:hypothetical protein